MSQARLTNDWQAPTPQRPPLQPGDTFETQLGPRRLIWAGVQDYFHRDNRRYRCEVVAVRQVSRRRGGYGDLQHHAVPTVRVLELA